MNRKEIADLLPIIQAFAAGEAIEGKLKPCTIRGIESNNDWREMDEILFSNNWVYRIKPKPGYRPFANAEECWQEMQKHQPIGWLKSSEGYYFQIVSMGKTFIGGTADSVGRIAPNSYQCLYNSYTFTVGLPFGVKVEE